MVGDIIFGLLMLDLVKLSIIFRRWFFLDTWKLWTQVWLPLYYCSGYKRTTLCSGLQASAGEVQAEAGDPSGPGHDHSHYHALPAKRGL